MSMLDITVLTRVAIGRAAPNAATAKAKMKCTVSMVAVCCNGKNMNYKAIVWKGGPVSINTFFPAFNDIRVLRG